MKKLSDQLGISERLCPIRALTPRLHNAVKNGGSNRTENQELLADHKEKAAVVTQEHVIRLIRTARAIRHASNDRKKLEKRTTVEAQFAQ